MAKAHKAKTRIHPAVLLVAVGALLARPAANAHAAEHVVQGGEAKPFWTAEHMEWTMGGVMVGLLVIMAIWRHVSLLRVNRRLVANISQRIVAQRELEESEARFRDLIETSPDAAFVDCDGEIVFANPAAAQLFGAVLTEQLVGKQALEFVHPDEHASVAARRRNLLGERNVNPMIERRGVRLDGSEFDNEARAMKFVWGGKPAFLVIMRDVSDRKRAEDALLESEERYRSLAEFVPEAVLVIERGKILFCNDAAVELFGAENKDQLIGLNQVEMVHPEDRPMLQARIDRGAGQDPRSTMLELRSFRFDGSEFVSESCSAPFFWNGESARLVILRDITERKRTEQQVGDLNHALEQRVEARTAELRSAQDELVKSERLATLGQLTATVSHELRNPLGAMRTSIYMLRNHMPPSDERLVRAAERIDRNITRCDGIIDELLDFTRIRELDIEPTGLDDWLGLVLDEQAVPDGVEVRRAPGASEIVVALDADRLRRAVVNVYDNACQAMTGQVAGSDGDRESVLTVATRAIRDRVEISFRDTGPGIPADLREKIFEPLFSTKGFGVGLGLCVVRQILEQHGGGVEIASQDGGGGEFMLWLPQHHYRNAAE